MAKRYLVNYNAIYDVTVEVDAENGPEAMQKARDGQGSMVEENWDRPHPDTEYHARDASNGEREPEPPAREWTVQVTMIRYGDVKVQARTADEACALADADYGTNAQWGETEFKVGDAFDTSQEEQT